MGDELDQLDASEKVVRDWVNLDTVVILEGGVKGEGQATLSLGAFDVEVGGCGAEKDTVIREVGGQSGAFPG